MPRHVKQKYLPYKTQQLFALVADVARYPEFLPWCQDIQIVSQRGNRMTAEMVIGYKGLSETFTSHVLFQKPDKIEVRYGGGALRSLETIWRFEEKGEGTLLSFFLDFSMKSVLLGGVMELFFDHAFRKMVDAFEKRADDLYGQEA